jgi:probable rRNA maturation factor
MTVTVDVWNDCETELVPANDLLQSWADLAVRHLQAHVTDIGKKLIDNNLWSNKPLSLGLRIVDGNESSRLNLAYRHKDYPTNVLSFASDLPAAIVDTLDEFPLGDLVICAPVVSREALEQNKEPAAHWAHMLVHGMLHLYGFDHQNDEDAETMEALEKSILAQIGFSDPYLEQ